MRGRHRRPPDNRVVGFSSIGAVVAVGAILAGISASSPTETPANAAAQTTATTPAAEAPKPVSDRPETTSRRSGTQTTPAAGNTPRRTTRKPATKRPATRQTPPSMPDWMRRWYCYYNPCK